MKKIVCKGCGLNGSLDLAAEAGNIKILMLFYIEKCPKCGSEDVKGIII